MKTKHFLNVFFICVCLAINAQTKVSINNATVNIIPSYTVNNGTSISITGHVKNVGTTTITANVHVNMAIDTSSTGTPKYFKRSTKTTPVVDFAPNAIFNFTVTDVADSGNGYKIAGNGTTIVVWTVVGLSTDTITALDSVLTTIYVIDVTDIEDWKDSDNQSIFIQNPTLGGILNIEFLILNNEHIVVELINSQGKCLLKEIVSTHISTHSELPSGGSTATNNLKLNINNCESGVYYLNFYNKEQNKTSTKKVIIN